MTMPPSAFHCWKVPYHFEISPCLSAWSDRSSGLSPRYGRLLWTLQGDPPLAPSPYGRRQGGVPPFSRASTIWSVICWRMSLWFGMAAHLRDGSLLVGHDRSVGVR